MANSVNKALLEKYLNNTCTPEERARVALFLQEPDGKALLDEFLTERLPADMQATEENTIDTARVANWKAEIQARMEQQQIPEKKVKYLPRLRQVAMWAAILFGVGYYAIHFSNKNGKQPLALLKKETPFGQRSMITLTDGSTVLLGAGSRFTYPENFTDSIREVTLEGEAFFEVSHNPSKPFIIHTGEIQTRVLGTSFRISAFHGLPVTVAVATGKVRVEGLTEMAVLTPGNQLTWHPSDHSAIKATVDVADIEGWKKGRIAFNNTKLKDVATELERWYDVKIVFKQLKKAEEGITVTLFASAPLEKTLEVLAAGNGFRYTINKKEIIIH
ncbi:FecR domain-containing protein [Chitinophaga niabensis]|uniref:FecR family protein n=1 Tax=Chitinophaga niabensis TaxID=536979 RepID=UPI0031BB3688